MAAPSDPSPDEARLLDALRRAVAEAPSRPTEIEVGIALSIALGRARPVVACGGCQTPLEFDGIPARTNTRLSDPFRLLYSDPAVAAAPGS